MAFPFTHLLVAHRILELRPMPDEDAAQFLLGSIAPDAVHFRAEFQGAAMKSIGAAKKITHLCPISDERWGSVTDNDGWLNRVKEFLHDKPDDPLAAGYAVHVLTDLHNNRTLWDNFRTAYPDEAAKGYSSDYYKDLRNIDTRLFLDLPQRPEVMALLSHAAAKPISWGTPLIVADELRIIQNNILHEHFKNVAKLDRGYVYRFISFDDTLAFIRDAADFCVESLK